MEVLLCASGAAVQYLVIPLDSLSAARLVLAVLLRRRRPRRQVAALFLGDVGLWAVDRLHVLPERAGIRVALRAAGNLTYVGFLQVERKYQGLVFKKKKPIQAPPLRVLLPTSLECVRFWCLARSEALEKALLHPSCSQTYGFSPVCERRWVFRFSRRE